MLRIIQPKTSRSINNSRREIAEDNRIGTLAKSRSVLNHQPRVLRIEHSELEKSQSVPFKKRNKMKRFKSNGRLESDEELMDLFNKVKQKQMLSQHIQEKQRSSNLQTVGHIHGAFRGFMREDGEQQEVVENRGPIRTTNVKLVPRNNSSDLLQRVIPTNRDRRDSSKPETQGNYNIKASDEIQRVTRWEKIVNNKLGKAKMQQFLD